MVKPVNKCILVGVSGGIAAYKCPELIRRLKEHDADVRVAMTANASSFITALTLQAVSGHPVHQVLLDSDAESGMDHIELARWADIILIAPASADVIARLAHGLADDLLATVCLASNATLCLAPAMNQQMWQHPATIANTECLRQRGVHIFGPGLGDQACGETGPGRMLEPQELVDCVSQLGAEKTLTGVKVTITAGPTWEAIDPVRGITNHSSGKMGYAIAQASVLAGAIVSLVSGPCSLTTPTGVTRINVQSAADMLNAVEQKLDQTDIFIGVAAVADYRPVTIAANKIKKTADDMTIQLVKNTDILTHVTDRPNPPYTVGFAAETENVITNAREKLKRKRLDLIVANQVGGGKAFGVDNNHLTLIAAAGNSAAASTSDQTDLGKGSKTELAHRLIDELATRFHAKN